MSYEEWLIAWHVTKVTRDKKIKNCSYTTRFSHFHSFGHFSECIHFVIMSRALIGCLRSWTWLVWTCVHWCRHWWWSCQTWNNELWLVEPHFKYNCIFVRLFFTFEMVFNYHCDTRKKFRFQVRSILTQLNPSNRSIFNSGRENSRKQNWCSNQVQFRLDSSKVNEPKKSKLIRNKRLNNKDEYLNVIKDCHVVIDAVDRGFKSPNFKIKIRISCRGKIFEFLNL